MPRTVIIGGGIVGSCTAFFLRELDAGEVVVLEPDPSYARASTTLSAASIRTQFTLPLNVRMSLFGSEFLDRMEALPETALARRHHGYLVLAGPAGESALRESFAMQSGRGGRDRLVRPRRASRGGFPGSTWRTSPPARSGCAMRAGSMPMRCCAWCAPRRSGAARATCRTRQPRSTSRVAR